MDFLNIALLCIFTALIVKLISPISGEMALLTVIVCIIAVASLLSDHLSYILKRITEIGEYANISDGVLSICIKALGIGYACELCSSCCKDAGQSSLSSLIEIAGKLFITAISIPQVFSLIEMMAKILE